MVIDDRADWDHERWEAEASAALEAILQSSAPKRLAVAGPGTGKTYAFRKLFEQTPDGPNLAITFINNLVIDLQGSLGDLAEVYTFHGFCRRLLHSLEIQGVSRGVDYYPAFNRIVSEDISLTALEGTHWDDVDAALHNLDNSTGLIDLDLRSGDYYNAVGYTDSVYRVLKHLQEHREDIPTYRQVAVDEYQDFSLLEVKFIEQLSRGNPTFVVGDDDQALYGFKHASANYIRHLAADENWERCDLPFCTRCTEVLVEAVHTVVARAQAMGLLGARLNKPYFCYLPGKHDDSIAYPRITHAHCSVERNNAPYMARYIHQRILEIPASEVAASYEGGNPTVLIVGPVQFGRRIYEYLSNYFENVEMKESVQIDVEMLDGYQRLRLDEDSRLGWRIVTYCDPPPGLPEILRRALVEGEELSELLPESYRLRHQSSVAILRKLIAEEQVNEEEIRTIEAAVGMPYLELRRELSGGAEADSSEDVSGEETDGSRAPRIVVTSLVGAKGLQAEHVFVVGLNGRHFPVDNGHPTEDEVCCLLVALTRAKRKCYLVSCGRFGNQPLQQSIFLEWLEPVLDHESIDAAWFRSLGS